MEQESVAPFWCEENSRLAVVWHCECGALEKYLLGGACDAALLAGYTVVAEGKTDPCPHCGSTSANKVRIKMPAALDPLEHLRHA